MYLLNGDRVYIKSNNTEKYVDEQVNNCISQLLNIDTNKRLYKLNFFVAPNSKDHYEEIMLLLKAKVKKEFSSHVIISVLSQAPLDCGIAIEAFFYDSDLWQADYVNNNFGEAICFKQGHISVLMGNSQSFDHCSCEYNSVYAFNGVGDLLNKFSFSISSIVRQWNYIEDILKVDEYNQNYQEFNNVRSEFYGDYFDKNGYPAATGIGMKYGGVLIEFIAVRGEQILSLPIDNPVQIAAHSYSKNVLVGKRADEKNTPKFERARYLDIFKRSLVFISGTAAIRGEITIGSDNISEQVSVAIDNVKKLYSVGVIDEINEQTTIKDSTYRVYIKNRHDYKIVKDKIEDFWKENQVLYVIADICRNNLLTEIEGEVVIN